MKFPEETFIALREYAKAEDYVTVSVINQFEQEFKIKGFIPKYHVTKTSNLHGYGVALSYFFLNFGEKSYRSDYQLHTQDNRAAILLLCPEEPSIKLPNGSIPPLTIKSIIGKNGELIYKNENYPYAVLEIRNKIYKKHVNRDHWKMTKIKEKIAKILLGKAPIYLGDEYPKAKGRRCLVYAVIDGNEPNTFTIYLKHENFGTYGKLCDIPVSKIDSVFDLDSINEEEFSKNF